ncbi:MAG: hypothetical protein ACFB00_12085 [Parvularculaceae bacterium]
MKKATASDAVHPLAAYLRETNADFAAFAASAGLPPDALDALFGGRAPLALDAARRIVAMTDGAVDFDCLVVLDGDGRVADFSARSRPSVTIDVALLALALEGAFGADGGRPVPSDVVDRIAGAAGAAAEALCPLSPDGAAARLQRVLPTILSEALTMELGRRRLEALAAAAIDRYETTARRT